MNWEIEVFLEKLWMKLLSLGRKFLRFLRSLLVLFAISAVVVLFLYAVALMMVEGVSAENADALQLVCLSQIAAMGIGIYIGWRGRKAFGKQTK